MSSRYIRSDDTNLINAIREVLGLAPITGEPILTEADRFYRPPSRWASSLGHGQAQRHKGCD